MSSSIPQNCRRGPRTLAARAALVLLLSTSVLLALVPTPTDAAFQFVPILQVYATALGSSRTYDETQERCVNSGGFMACEPTQTTHTASIQAAERLAGGSTYYAFLGGDTRAYRPPTSGTRCPLNALIVNDQTGGYPAGGNGDCLWSWNQGRWTRLNDDMSIRGNLPGIGIAFFGANVWNFVGQARVLNDMSNFFNNESTSDNYGIRRPGMLYGQSLVLVGNGPGSAEWSDNNEGPGYQYKDYIYNGIAFRSVFNPVAISTTISSFLSVCQVGTPTREDGERLDTSSGLQLNWWAIFFSILFFLCFVAFIIIACCQEREDMDEPPEDAPEWAQKQADDRQQNSTFVSQRSFRAYDDEYDDDDDTDGTAGSGRTPRSGSARGGENPMNAPSQRGIGGGKGNYTALDEKEADYVENI